jgi:integrase
VFNAAVEDQLISVSPCRKIARQPVTTARVVPLTVEQVEKLVAATPAHFRALIVTAVGTGLRQDEALGLREADVDFLRREVHVRHQLVSVPGVAAHLGPAEDRKQSAHGAGARVRPGGVCRAPPTVHARPVGHVFSNTRGKAVNRQSLHRSLAAALRAADLPAGITFHQLRHTYA